MNTPNLSVIMPVYNVEAYLHQAIISILQQSYTDFELLAVNDGSTDKSRLILSEYAKAESKISIIDQSNKGLSAARNAGLQKAKGQYVYFFDSDDELADGAFSEIMGLAKKTNSDVIHFSSLAINEQSDAYTGVRRIGHHQTEPIPGKNLFKEVMESRNYATNVQKYVIKRRFLQDHNLIFDEGFIHEDESFTIEMLCLAEKVTSLDKPFLKKRFREGSIMRAETGIENVKGWLKAAIRLSNFYRENKLGKDVEVQIQHKIDQLTKISLKNIYRIKKRERKTPDMYEHFSKNELRILGKPFQQKLNFLFLYMLKEKINVLFKRILFV